MKSQQHFAKFANLKKIAKSRCQPAGTGPAGPRAGGFCISECAARTLVNRTTKSKKLQNLHNDATICCLQPSPATLQISIDHN